MSLREKLIEAGIVKVVTTAKVMRRSRISLFPRPHYALTDADGITRLGVDDIVRLALDAVLDCLVENADEWGRLARIKAFPEGGNHYEHLLETDYLAVLRRSAEDA